MIRKAFVTGCNIPYLEGAIPLLRMVKKFHPEVERYCIVPADEANAIRGRLEGLAHVMAAPRAIAGIPEKLQVAVAKLFITTIDADVVAWVDCDAILCRPAPEIWDVEPGTVTAVRDTAYRILDMVPTDLRDIFIQRHPEAVDQKGLNGGFFALRPADWIHLPEMYERELKEANYPRYPAIMDQPLLGSFWLGRTRWLPFTFNAHHVFDYSIPREPRIVHFTNQPKPWRPDYPKHEPAYYYWLRHGEGENRTLRLLACRFKIIMRTPRRIFGRSLRRWGLRPERPIRKDIRPGV